MGTPPPNLDLDLQASVERTGDFSGCYFIVGSFGILGACQCPFGLCDSCPWSSVRVFLKFFGACGGSGPSPSCAFVRTQP